MTDRAALERQQRKGRGKAPRHPDDLYVLVKEGFSWPAFFFGPLWALSHRMWVVSALLFAALIAIGMVPVSLLAIAFFGFNLWGLGFALAAFFLNLFLNARDAMPRGGWLSVATRADGDVVLAEGGHQVGDPARAGGDAMAADKHQRFTGRRGRTGDHVHHPGRESGLVHDPHQLDDRERLARNDITDAATPGEKAAAEKAAAKK